MQSLNGVNIQLFQFEGDLTWMSFFMDANDRIYARYGGRDESKAESHLNQKSLTHVMRQVLHLHKTGDVQTSRYEAKPTPVRTPEDIPPMNAMIARRKENKCIHCHDVKVAELRHLQQQNQFTRDMLFTYPQTQTIGIDLDPVEQNRVRRVLTDSPAAKAGLRDGDVVRSVDGQRILTFSDFTRVLELTPDTATLPISVQRAEQQIEVTLALSGNWKRNCDPSWRETLHVAGPGGGFWGRAITPEERRKHGLPEEGTAVQVTTIWGPTTRESGLRVNDIVTRLDGKSDLPTIQRLHAHLHLRRNWGETVPITIRRDGREQQLQLKLPAAPASD